MRSVYENGGENNKLKSLNQLFLRNKTCVSLALLLFWETQKPWAGVAFPLTWCLGHSHWELRELVLLPPELLLFHLESLTPHHGGKVGQSLGLCSQHFIILIILQGEAYSLLPSVQGQPWCCLQPKGRIGEWALLLFSFWWPGFYCSGTTSFQNILH